MFLFRLLYWKTIEYIIVRSNVARQHTENNNSMCVTYSKVFSTMEEWLTYIYNICFR